jgi:hypothetical protein
VSRIWKIKIRNERGVAKIPLEEWDDLSSIRQLFIVFLLAILLEILEIRI